MCLLTANIMLLTACRTKTEHHTGERTDNDSAYTERSPESNGVSQKTDIYGYYLFEANPSASEDADHSEDGIIKIGRKDGKLCGMFWTTSDEFVDAREGYLPGFIVLEMQDLKRDGDRIAFMLDSRNKRFFSAPLSLDITSGEEAASKGYHDWRQESRFFADTIRFHGHLRGDTLFLDETKNRWARMFVRKGKGEIERMERKLKPEVEQWNRSQNDEQCSSDDF